MTKQDTIESYLSSLMRRDIIPLGFEFVKDDITSCIKIYKEGWDRYSFNLRSIGGKFIVQFVFVRRINIIEDLWLEYKDLLGQANQPSFAYATFSLYHHRYPEIKSFSCAEDKEGLTIVDVNDSEFEKVYNLILQNYYLPLSHKYENIVEIDKIINRSIPIDDEAIAFASWQGIEFKKMIVAKYASNQNYEAICEEMKMECLEQAKEAARPGFESYKNFPAVFEKVYEKLKSINV